MNKGEKMHQWNAFSKTPFSTKTLSKDMMWLTGEVKEKLIIWFIDYFKDIPFFFTRIQRQIANMFKSEAHDIPTNNQGPLTIWEPIRHHRNHHLHNAVQTIKPCFHIWSGGNSQQPGEPYLVNFCCYLHLQICKLGLTSLSNLSNFSQLEIGTIRI